MKKTIAATAAVICMAFTAAAQSPAETEVLKGWLRYANAPNALYNHLAAGAYPHLTKRKQAVAGLRTLPQWQQHQQQVRKTLQEAVGAFPARTPLQVQVTATRQKDGYRVENILYESQPGFFVTGSLFVPAGAARAPAVLYCSGHSASGYRSAAYQRVILNLVKKGFVVFAFDPVGQGERLEYIDTATGKSRHKWPSNEHSYPGAQVFLTGNTLAMYMIWDGIRAIDLLVSRKEVDPQRIAVTGRSGGGTQAAYIAAFDERVKVAAPENYITSFTRLFESIGPQDAEQNFFNGIARGLDMGDLLMARAPKPCLMITTARDMFSIQGAMETAAEVTRLYNAYGQPANFVVTEDDAPHASTKKNREALYAFLQKHLSQPGSAKDEELTPLRDEELQVSSTGQLHTAMKSETIFSLNLQRAAQKRSTTHGPAMLAAAKKRSGYHAPSFKAVPVFTGRLQKEGYVIEKAFISGEGDYVIPYLLMKPARANGKAILWLQPSGKSKTAGMEQLVEKGFTVLAPDMVGTGETGPGIYKGDSYIDSISYNLWFAAIQTGRSITGIRAADAVMLAHLLKDHYGIKAVYGMAEEEMTPVLLHAAAFDPAISRVALLSPAPAWYTLATTRLYDPRFIQGAVAGAIGVYDLPDLAASLAPRRLLIADGDSSEQPVINTAYQRAPANGQLKTGTAEELQPLLNWWLED